MYSYNDFERLFVRYKLEGLPLGISIEKFCMSNKVPYNLYAKWYKDTRKKIMPVQVIGVPSTEVEPEKTTAPSVDQQSIAATPILANTELRILVDIRMSNGVHISQKNLSYDGLKNLVEKLEGLC